METDSPCSTSSELKHAQVHNPNVAGFILSEGGILDRLIALGEGRFVFLMRARSGYKHRFRESGIPDFMVSRKHIFQRIHEAKERNNGNEARNG